METREIKIRNDLEFEQKELEKYQLEKERKEQLRRQIKKIIMEFKQPCLAEEFIKGKDIEINILGNKIFTSRPHLHFLRNCDKLYSMRISPNNMKDDLFIRRHHKDKFQVLNFSENYRVERVNQTSSIENVWCVVEPEEEEGDGEG